MKRNMEEKEERKEATRFCDELFFSCAKAKNLHTSGKTWKEAVATASKEFDVKEIAIKIALMALNAWAKGDSARQEQLTVMANEVVEKQKQERLKGKKSWLKRVLTK